METHRKLYPDGTVWVRWQTETPEYERGLTGEAYYHGRYEEFNLDGRCLQRGMFAKGLADGPWEGWYPDGRTKAWEFTLVKGLKDGRYTGWYPSGAMGTTGAFSGAQPEGTWRFWDQDGKGKPDIVYRLGLPVPVPVTLTATPIATAQKSAGAPDLRTQPTAVIDAPQASRGNSTPNSPSAAPTAAVPKAEARRVPPVLRPGVERWIERASRSQIVHWLRVETARSFKQFPFHWLAGALAWMACVSIFALALGHRVRRRAGLANSPIGSVSSVSVVLLLIAAAATLSAVDYGGIASVPSEGYLSQQGLLLACCLFPTFLYFVEATLGGLSRIWSQLLITSAVLATAWRLAEGPTAALGLVLSRTFSPSSAIAGGLAVLLVPVASAEWLATALIVRGAWLCASWTVWPILELLSFVELAAVSLAAALLVGVTVRHRQSFDQRTTEGAYLLGLAALALGALGPALRLASGHVWAEFLSVAVCFSLAQLLAWIAIPLPPATVPVEPPSPRVELSTPPPTV